MTKEVGTNVWRCAFAHRVDASARGVAALMTSSSKTRGDDENMVRARERFLRRALYDDLSATIGKMMVRGAGEASERASGEDDDDDEDEDEDEDDVTEDDLERKEAKENEVERDERAHARDSLKTTSPRQRKLAAKRERRKCQRATTPAIRPIRKRSFRALDLGCGDGHHAQFLSACARESGLAFELVCVDASRAACERCAKTNPEAFVAQVDAMATLPFYDGSIDAIMSVFAPRVPRELARVLRGNGRVVIASAEPEHMGELRENGELGARVVAIEEGKKERVEEQMQRAGFELVDREIIRGVMRLDGDAMADLIAMGPSGYHNDAEAIERVRSAPPRDVTKAFSVSVFQKIRR